MKAIIWLNPLRRWCKAHPIEAIVWCGTLAASLVLSVFWTWAAFIVYVFVSCLWMLRCYLSDKKAGLLAIAIALTAQPARAPELIQPAGQILPYIAGGVVLVAGGIVVVKVIRFCQRHYPKDPPKTNEPPAELQSATYGASWTFSSQPSCGGDARAVPEWALPDETQAMLEFSGVIVSTTNGPAIRRTAVKLIDTMFVTDFNLEMLSHGLQVPSFGPSRFYSLNDIPCRADQSPIFITEDHVINIENGLFNPLMVIDKSTDLKSWSEVCMIRMPLYIPFKVQDFSVTQQTFYRIRLLQ